MEAPRDKGMGGKGKPGKGEDKGEDKGYKIIGSFTVMVPKGSGKGKGKGEDTGGGPDKNSKGADGGESTDAGGATGSGRAALGHSLQKH